MEEKCFCTCELASGRPAELVMRPQPVSGSQTHKPFTGKHPALRAPTSGEMEGGMERREIKKKTERVREIEEQGIRERNVTVRE